MNALFLPKRALGLTLGLTLLTGLNGCAVPASSAASASAADAVQGETSQAAAAAAPAGAASHPGAAASAPPVLPGQPAPFSTVIKGATRTAGAFALWRRDERIWLELGEKDLGVPLFLSPKLMNGLGEAGFYGGLMASRFGHFGKPQLVEFRRINNQVQLIARNTGFEAIEGSPQARAVRTAFSPSLIGSAAVASQPHPQSKAVLIEVGPMFNADLLGLAIQLQRHYRQGYAYDARNSAVITTRVKPDEVIFETEGHYATASVASPQHGAPPTAPQPSLPTTLPDVRSLFLRVHYGLSRLPAAAMKPRRADQRLGHFVTGVSDFGDELPRSPRQRFVNRWRLEKKEPAAALSPPVRPITYWLDRNIPVRYRETIRQAILEWNKAFEKIGFQDAIVVQQQPDNAEFDTLDLGTASVRWMTNAAPSFGAIGPSHVDPRSGEILDADIGIESLSSRAIRTARAQVLATSPLSGAGSELHPEQCQHAEHGAEQLGFALDVLEAQGVLPPDSPEVERFVLAYLRDTVMHEVGHTLGLRHNFRASRVHTEAELADPAFTASHALAGSVMEYVPVNLPRPGQPMPAPFQTTLGPYDYWAIEYAYGVWPADKEAAELVRIAARSAEPELAYGTDEDAMLGVDPEVLTFDLGNDPVAFAATRLEIVRDLIRRQEQRSLDPQQDYSVLRRSLGYALRDLGRSAGVLSRQIGGIRTLRDFPDSGRDPIEPLPAVRQRAALDLIGQILAGEGLSVSAALQRRLAPDYLERADALSQGDAVVTDYAPQQALLDVQKALLTQLYSDGVTQRLLDSESRVESGAALKLSELHARIERELWAEPLTEGTAARRELQRELLQRLVAQLLRPAGQLRPEARALWRSQARRLLERLSTAQARRGASEVARAHWQDSAEMLKDALEARVVRSAP
jgi:hypothetical protein